MHKVIILSDLKKGAWGGGNQFQRALKNYFISIGVYTKNIEKADIILVNSHHWDNQLLKLMRVNHNDKQVIIHRVDGPISIVRGKKEQQITDDLIIKFNKLFADGTIFQSEWSRKECIQMGMPEKKSSKTILNAPDSNIFYPADNKSPSHKIRIIATSWSDNWRKGFDIYEYLDKHLNFDKYSFTFVGNSPITFNNVIHKDPLPSMELASELRKHDLYITASIDDPCSNSLIEALHCSLPAVVRNSGGHPEIVKKGGVLFEGNMDVIQKIDLAAHNIKELKNNIDLPSMEEVGKLYYDFALQVYNKNVANSTKRINKFDSIDLLFWHWKYKAIRYIRNKIKT